MAAAHAGARCTAGVDGNSLKMALGVLMLAVAPLVPLRDRLADKGGGESAGVSRVSSERVTTMLAIGAGSGFLAGVFGVGGGVLTVPSVSLATDLGHKKVNRD
ncbi:unnamed protein product [Ectocarpus fasciculatus]